MYFFPFKLKDLHMYDIQISNNFFITDFGILFSYLLKPQKSIYLFLRSRYCSTSKIQLDISKLHGWLKRTNIAIIIHQTLISAILYFFVIIIYLNWCRNKTNYHFLHTRNLSSKLDPGAQMQSIDRVESDRNYSSIFLTIADGRCIITISKLL